MPAKLASAKYNHSKRKLCLSAFLMDKNPLVKNKSKIVAKKNCDTALRIGKATAIPLILISESYSTCKEKKYRRKRREGMMRTKYIWEEKQTLGLNRALKWAA